LITVAGTPAANQADGSPSKDTISHKLVDNGTGQRVLAVRIRVETKNFVSAPEDTGEP
jgi:hypothetical protein